MKTSFEPTKAIATLSMLAAMTGGITGCAATSEGAEGSAEALTTEAPCTSTENPPAKPLTAEAVSAPYLESIARLKALKIFEVSPLRDSSHESGNCYASDIAQTAIGPICVQDVPKLAKEIAAADKKLANVVALAEKVAAKNQQGFGGSPPSNLDALKNLHVFEVGGFIEEAPESYTCYGMCNPSNIKRSLQLEEILDALAPPKTP
jgi:hypothetical protein